MEEMVPMARMAEMVISEHLESQELQVVMVSQVKEVQMVMMDKMEHQVLWEPLEQEEKLVIEEQVVKTEDLETLVLLELPEKLVKQVLMV